MKKLLMCNLLFTKRSFKKLSFVLMIFLIPLLCYFLKDSTGEKNTIQVGVYAEEDTEITRDIINHLQNDYDSVDFIVYKDEETMKKNVINQTLECGYVFDEKFDNKVLKGKEKNVVTVYVGSGSISSVLTNEYVFGELFKRYALSELETYIKKDDTFSKEELKDMKEELSKLYEENKKYSNIFDFQYIYDEDTSTDSTSVLSSYIMTSVRGVIALLIMFVAFMGTLNLYRDEKLGIFFAFGPVNTVFAKLAEIFTVTFWAGVSGLITIYICNLQKNAIYIEVGKILLYVLICTIYCFLVYKLVPNQLVFSAMIPIFILGSIIFCPIFIDFSEILPAVRKISWAFLPRYYLL